MNKVIWTVMILFISYPLHAQEYRFHAGDTIEIFVYNNPEISGEYRIQPDGFIRLPLIGKVPVSDVTEEELYSILTEAITVYVKNPYITVIPKFAVSVIGEVKEPGVYTITGAERIIEVISMAGGFTDEASNKVNIFRGDEVLKISKKSVIKSDSVVGLIRPGDVIVVNKKLFTRANMSVLISAFYAISLSLYYFSEK